MSTPKAKLGTQKRKIRKRKLDEWNMSEKFSKWFKKEDRVIDLYYFTRKYSSSSTIDNSRK